MNNISRWKKIVQWVITLFLVGALFGGIYNARARIADRYANTIGEESIEPMDEYDILEQNLVYGEYGYMVEYYVLTTKVYGMEVLSDSRYDRFREFIDFYETYITYVKYAAFDEQCGFEQYAAESLECMEKMQEIVVNSEFKENAPYYEDLLSKINGE